MAHGLRRGVALLVPRTSARGSERNRCSSHWLRGTIKGAIRRSRPVCPLPRQNVLKARAPIEIDLRTANVDRVEQDIQAGRDLAIWRRTLWASTVGPRWQLATYRGSRMDQLPLPDPSISMERARKAQKRIKDLHDIGDEEAARELTVSFSHIVRGRVWRKRECIRSPVPSFHGSFGGMGEADLAATLEQALSERTSVRRHSRCTPPRVMDSDTPIVTEPEFLKRITVRTDVDVCAPAPARTSGPGCTS